MISSVKVGSSTTTNTTATAVSLLPSIYLSVLYFFQSEKRIIYLDDRLGSFSQENG